MPLLKATFEYYVVYVYEIADAAHAGALKIGKTNIKTATDCSNLTPCCPELMKAAQDRVDEQNVTAGTDAHLLWAVLGYFEDEYGKHFFDDDYVHEVLEMKGYKKKLFPHLKKNPKDWYCVDLATVQNVVASIKQGEQFEVKKSDEIILREEQERAIQQTIDLFAIPTNKKMLWNAKMRFGKTLCSLDLVRRQGYKRTLILTHRPAVRSGWFKDYHQLDFDNFDYGSKQNISHADTGRSFEELEERANKEAEFHYIYFASMQDLRGSKGVNANSKLDKNNGILAANWDLIILDEAHEGTQTSLGKAVVSELVKKGPKVLYLSGTPYNILHLFKDEEIYTWDYIMEQEAKAKFAKDYPTEHNPYEDLPTLNIMTYDLGDVFSGYLKRSDEDYFNFNEFWRTWQESDARFRDKVNEQHTHLTDLERSALMPDDAEIGQFVHEKDVRDFLNLLHDETQDTHYPFTLPEYLDSFRHTLWMLPGVASSKALSAILQEKDSWWQMSEHQFTVVNVAGEGDDVSKDDHDSEQGIAEFERKEKDALRRVELAQEPTAENPNPRTITLSCGRLTTGVTVKPWTGVFMLAGSYKTKASTYMQTIFRAQSPCHEPKLKTECYAFDFAPDRTLTVIDDFLKSRDFGEQIARTPQNHLGGDDDNHARRIERFLRYCSVISCRGSHVTQYNTFNFIERVNRVYSDNVIRSGFAGSALYRNLYEVNEEDLKLLNEVARILEMGKISIKRSSAPTDVVITDEGLTGENASAQESPSGETTPEEPKTPNGKKPRHTAKQKQNRVDAMAVLDALSIRLPLLLFGAVEDVEHFSLQSFVESIDNASWKLFMPKGIKKSLFLKLIPFYNSQHFIATVKAIIDRTKLADTYPVTKRVAEMAHILSLFHFPDKETILTPWRVVNMHMSDTIGGYDFYSPDHTLELLEPRFVDRGVITAEVLADPETSILEINSKSGIYPLWLAYSLWRIHRDKEQESLGIEFSPEEDELLWQRVIRDNLYVLCMTPMALKITERVLAGYKGYLTNCQFEPNLVKKLRGDNDKLTFTKSIKRYTYWHSGMANKKITFKAVVGNPPYNEMDHGAGASATPIYQYFCDTAFQLNPKYASLIIPARWYVAGKKVDKFRDMMLRNKNIRSLHDYRDSSQCFSKVDIKGGVCYFMSDTSYFGDCELTTHKVNRETYVCTRPLLENWAESFIRDSESVSIVNKVSRKAEASFTELVSSRDPFGYDIREENSMKTVAHKYSLEPSETETIKFYYNGWRKEGIGYVTRESVNEHVDWIDKFKVLIPRSWGNGIVETDRVHPFIAGLGEVCTETYVVVGPFETEAEALACQKYLNTRFFHILVSVMKITQQAAVKIYQMVPLQDFTESSDIDWTKSVDEVDEQLFDKYELTTSERAYIKKLIKPLK